jgi:TPR repeat protein
MNFYQMEALILDYAKNNKDNVLNNCIDKETILTLTKQKDPDSQYLLGLIYDHGVGVEKDENMAYQLYLEATKKGHSAAQRIIGNKRIEKEQIEATNMLNNNEEIPRYNMFSVKKLKTN